MMKLVPSFDEMGWLILHSDIEWMKSEFSLMGVSILLFLWGRVVKVVKVSLSIELHKTFIKFFFPVELEYKFYAVICWDVSESESEGR